MEITYTIEDFVREVRTAYKSKFLILHMGWNEDTHKNTLEEWIYKLNSLSSVTPEEKEQYRNFQKILEGLCITEFQGLALFHYIGFDVIYGGSNSDYPTPESYWNAFGGLYRTCRSTVIDLYSGETVIKPFDKFFNVNELPETAQEEVERLIEKAKSVEISEKLDGSIVCASSRPVSDYRGSYYRTYLCTSQSLNPETSWHLAEARKMLEETEGIRRILMDFPETTFMFEMLSEWDPHVVHYSEEQCGLHLIGFRKPSGELARYSEVVSLAHQYGVQTTQVFGKTFGEVLSELDDKKSDEAEGFVIRVDDQFFKLKYNDYVNMHKILGRLTSASGIIESYFSGHIDDLMSKIPVSYKRTVQSIIDQIEHCKYSVGVVTQCAQKECYKLSELRDQMIWIQQNMPKMLQGYCIQAVKTGAFQINRGNRVLRLSNIEEISKCADHWIERHPEETHRPDNPYYGKSAHKVVDDNGEFLNFGVHTSAEEDYNY